VSAMVAIASEWRMNNLFSESPSVLIPSHIIGRNMAAARDEGHAMSLATITLSRSRVLDALFHSLEEQKRKP
jgi:hypothetical protein